MIKKVAIVVLIVAILGISYYFLFLKDKKTEDPDIGEIELPTETGVFGAVFSEEQLNSVIRASLTNSTSTDDKPIALTFDLHDNYADFVASLSDGQTASAKIVSNENGFDLAVIDGGEHQKMFNDYLNNIRAILFAGIDPQKLEIKDQRMIVYFKHRF